MRKIIISTLLILTANIHGQAVKYFSPVTAVIITNIEAFEVGPCTIYTNPGVTVNVYANEAAKNDAITKISAAAIPALPSSGTIEQGRYYSYNYQIIQCLQTHERTIYDPLVTPALFAVFRDNTGTLPWITNEAVKVGWKRTYNGTIYVVLQAHQTQESWRPDLTVGTLWQVVPTTQEWTVGVAYKVNDIVTYQGSTYKCLQAHTSISTWYPSVVPALWQKQ